MDGNWKMIFSLYIDIPEEELEKDLGPFPGELIERTIQVKKYYDKYYTRLIDNHTAYAKHIGVPYIPFGRDAAYMSFYEDLKSKYPYIPEYHIINFYKFHLLEEMTKKYEKVLYIDLDVVFNTEENFFDTMTEGLHIFAKDLKEDLAPLLNTNNFNLHRRAPIAKWFLVKAMCLESFTPYEDVIYNTGIMAADRKTMEHLGYMDNLDECLKLINKLKEDGSIFTKNITDTFDWNNEVIASYLIFKNQVPIVNTDGPWNYHERRKSKPEFDYDDKKIIHFIRKHFEWYFGE